MSGFIFFAIIVFVVIPIIKNTTIKKTAKKPAKKSSAVSTQQSWSQVQALLQQKIKEQTSAQRNAHGHSAARRNTRQRMHSGDGDTEVFPSSHQARVRKRDNRARSERNRIEAMMHSKKNQGITRESNKSIDTWGARGDKSGGGGLLFLLLFGLVVFFVLSKIAPDLWLEIMRALSPN